MTATLHKPEDVVQLKELVAAEPNAEQRDRYRAALLALTGRADGGVRAMYREEIAATLSRSRQFVDEWVGRYRDGGVDALRPKKQPGRARRLDAAQEQQLCATLDAGPDEASGRSAFTGRDVCDFVVREFGKSYSLNGAYKLLHRLGYSYLMPRPRHPKADPVAEEAFEKATDELARVTAAHPDKRVLPYFQDEARVGQKGVLARVWARTNSRPTALKQTQYDYLYVFGAVCPETGDSFGLIAPRVDTGVMNQFLESFGALLPADVHALMILDSAGWHHCADLVVPGNVTLLFLPPRAPELNPIERLWLWLKGHYWANRAYADYDAMVAAIESAWKKTVDEPGRVKSVCHAPYLVRAN